MTSTVGVKAVDDYTVEYTWTSQKVFWNSKVTTNHCSTKNSLISRKDYGAAAPSGILYNGPYILKNFTSKSVIEYEKN